MNEFVSPFIRTRYMNFSQAYFEMLKGKKVRRHGWQGYWYIDKVTGVMTIHLASGKEITTGEFDTTIKNTFALDWEIVEEKEDEES